MKANDLARRHSHGLTVGVVAVLAGFAVTAFGIAPLAPDAASLPQRTVVEEVLPENLDAQLEALATHSLELWRSDVTRPGDTVDTLLGRLGITDAAAAAFLRADPTARRVAEGRSGKMIRALAGADGTLLELVARYPAERAEQFNTHFTRLAVTRDDGAFSAGIETLPLETQSRLASGTVTSSLWAAADETGLPEAVTVQLAEIFSTDIDFHRELRRGDRFTLVYEALSADGEPVTWNQGTGRVIAAEFINDGRVHTAVWFRSAGGRGDYYDIDGQSKRRAFLSSPMEFSRVSSRFSMRFHPILKTWRRHLGVDYAAPTGTPVRVVGDGVVEFAGRQNGYGNVVIVRHANKRSTLYAHLSRIHVRQGQRVEQGERIGSVGATGWATGPHLHFEFRADGQHLDPLKVAKASEAVKLDGASRRVFAEYARSAQVQLEAARTMTVGQARDE